MKTIYLQALLLVIFPFSLLAQYRADSYEESVVKGYFIREYIEQEVKDVRSDIFYIDLYKKTFFIPIKRGLFTENVIDSIKNYNSSDLYFLPSKQTTELIKVFSGLDFSKEQFNFRMPVKSAVFFNVKNQRKYIYNIYFSEFKVIKATIINTRANALRLNVYFNQKAEYLTCYFLYQPLILQEINNIYDDNFKKVTW
ncbi:MAG TPA: hypothetical protein VKB19_19700 [Pedobacter sp.]|nr:hypothetical protein [Pedobacter sp.]